jgi:hypothetical protein
MTAQKAAKLSIAISIVFAIAIMLGTWLTADTQYHQVVTYVLIAIWFIPYSYLSTISSKDR